MSLSQGIKAQTIAKILNERYPIEAHTDEPVWQLVLTAVLATQVKFTNVDKIRGELFKGKTLADLANSSFDDIYPLVKHIRFGKVKTERFLACAKKMLADCNGNVPNDVKYLQNLPGIGRKNAAVIQSMHFNTPSIAVDTHVIRICNRLGISQGSNPVKVEEDMKNYFDRSCWSRIHQQFMYFGQDICRARNPKCDQCPLANACVSHLNRKSLIYGE